MAGHAGDDAAAKCREARRRRIEMRKFIALGVAEESSSSSSSQRTQRTLLPHVPAPASEHRPRSKRPWLADSVSPPSILYSILPPSTSDSDNSLAPTTTISNQVVFGSVALAGRKREMEDAVSIRPGFFKQPSCSPLHFFAVFDGHGGSHVSELCKRRMHELLAEELAAAEKERWREAVRKSFARMDEIALTACACGSVGRQCGCERSGLGSDIVGSTAAVAVVGEEQIVVANCGDSRAVLSRAGVAVPLSSDHKPDRPDELARIEAAGGRVVFQNGARVQGILAMSRALGDKYLKPVVSSEPEITTTRRTSEDECLIIASDGLWDVIPNNLACDVTRKCLAEGSPDGCTEDGSFGVGSEGELYASDARCSVAAALLARLAIGRQSGDNISVIVIDLKRSNVVHNNDVQ